MYNAKIEGSQRLQRRLPLAGSGDFFVARSGTGKFRHLADRNVCPSEAWLRFERLNFCFRVKYLTFAVIAEVPISPELQKALPFPNLRRAA
jgi:hypothetical protein